MFRSTDPVFVGTTTTVQVAVTRPIDAPITQPPAGRPPNDLLDRQSTPPMKTVCPG